MREAMEGKKLVEQYVQTLTHEIKSPLAAITGAAELLEEEMPLDKRRRFLLNIRRESARIRDVIDHLLLLSSIESRRELEDVVSLDLEILVREAIESLSGAITRKSLVVTTSIASPATIRGELFLIRQSLINLLANAVDFTPDKGSINVAVARSPSGIEITIDDSGSGIPHWAVPRVFERFYSLARPDTGRKGTGLGLSFVREAAALHGGQVSLANRAEGGARAQLVLPRDPPARQLVDVR